MQKKRGVLLIALGKPVYGRMALNACLSVKALVPHAPVALIYEQSALRDLTKERRAFFDYTMEAPPEIYTNPDGTKDYFKSKLYLDLLTPFKETLYLDADTILLPRKGRELLDVWDKSGDWQPQTELILDVETLEPKFENKKHLRSLWYDPAAAKRYYNFTWDVPRYNTSFVKFDRSERVDSLFNLMREMREDYGAPIKAFRKQRPDEFYFELGCARMGLMPEKAPYEPLHGFYACEERSYDLIAERYMGLMVYGTAGTPLHIKSIYNKIVDDCHARLGLKLEPYYHTEKA